MQVPPIPSPETFGGGTIGGVLSFLAVVAYIVFTEYRKSRNDKDKRVDEGNLALQLQKLNFAELSVKQQELLGSQISQLIIDLRAQIDDERKRSDRKDELIELKDKNFELEMGKMKNTIDELNKRIEETAEDRDNQKMLVLQIEQQQRVFCDNLKIAYWAITPDGHLEGNYTFFEDLTGLAAEECHNDGWFEAIAETSRDKTKQMWRQFLQNYATRPQFMFEFINKKTGNKTKTKVYCVSMVLEGQKVYKFTAQTAPLQLNDA